MAEVKGEVAVRGSGEVMTEIERTRENLASTIDALTERVSPGNVVRHSLTEFREQASRPQVRVAAGAVAVVTVAVIAFALWRHNK
jgi:Protein of unknown function (DUF3618)